MHGMKLSEGMKESTQFIPPLFTPSTKAEIGDKDENIHPDQSEFRSRALRISERKLIYS